MTIWKKRIGIIPSNAVSKTLSASTHMVPTLQAETSKVMKDHLRTRILPLKQKIMNNNMFADIFTVLLSLFVDITIRICTILKIWDWNASTSK